MCEACADVKEDGDQLQLTVLLRGLRTLRDPPTQIKSKSQKEKPRGDKPAEIVRQRNAKISAAVMPHPDFGYRRFGPVHHQVPLRHHKSRDDGQGYDVEEPIKAPVATIKQDGGDHPRKVAGSEPQRSDDNRNPSDVWEIRVDFKMVMPEGESRGHADIFDSESDRSAKAEKDQRGSKAIKDGPMSKG